MLTEKELRMYHSRGKKVRVICKDGTIVEGHCEMFTPPLDNDPEVAEISVLRGTMNLVGIIEPEIEEIEYLD